MIHIYEAVKEQNLFLKSLTFLHLSLKVEFLLARGKPILISNFMFVLPSHWFLFMSYITRLTGCIPTSPLDCVAHWKMKHLPPEK